jgi:hypothetical protein
MTKKRKVTVKTKDVTRSSVVTAGRQVSGEGQPTAEGAGTEETEVYVELGKVTDAEVVTAGEDAILGTADADLGTALDTLAPILERALENQEQIADLRDMVTELQAQAEQPPQDRNVAKLERILKSIGEYVGMAALTINQAQKVEALVGQIRVWLGI